MKVATKATCKPLAAAVPGEVGLFMHSAKVLVFKGAGENEKAAVILSELSRRDNGAPIRSYLLDEVGFKSYDSVIFFDDAVIVPDISSLHYSRETEQLSPFYVGDELYILVPDDISGWGRSYQYFNFNLSSFVSDIPDRSNGRWYFKNWSICLAAEGDKAQETIFRWKGDAA